MAIITVTKDNFEQEVLKSALPVLADFNAVWCGPCRMLKPTLEALSDERSDCKVVAIDIDDQDELADEYDVSSIPCVVLFKGGREQDRAIGLQPKEAYEALLEG